MDTNYVDARALSDVDLNQRNECTIFHHMILKNTVLTVIVPELQSG